MKTLLKISVLTFVLMAASSPCFAEQVNEDVSRERAKELGVTIRTAMYGQSGVKVWIEFKPQGVLKNFTHVNLEINAGEKRLVDAPLLTSRPTADSVSVHFSADPAYLAASVLTIVVQDGELARTGYRFKVKDFIEPEKSAQHTSPRWWLRAAAKHAADLSPQPEAGVLPASRKDTSLDILSEVLWLQVKAGDVEGALAGAKRYAPQLLHYVAHAQAVLLADTSGALATVGQIADVKEKRGALAGVADSLIVSGKLTDARRVLNDRTGDELTAGLYERLAQAQAKAGDVADTQASIKDIRDAPVGDGLNDVRRANAHVSLAAAQARAGNRQAYRESLAAARQLTQGFRPPYEDNTLVKIARTQADAGDCEAATATLNTLDPKERARFPDLVLAAQVKRGDVSPAQALAKVIGHSPVYEAAMEVQLAAKDHKAAAQTLKIAKEHYFLFSEIPTRIVNGFLTGADVDSAAVFVEGLTDPVMRAQLYGHIAARRADAGDRPSYQSLMVKAIASAMHVVDQRPGGASARPCKSEVLGQLAQIQAAAKDFEGAKKTIAIIEAPEDRRTYEVQLQLRARELAAAGRLEEARAWVASLPNAEDRAQACLTVAKQLMPAPKRP